MRLQKAPSPWPPLPSSFSTTHLPCDDEVRTCWPGFRIWSIYFSIEDKIPNVTSSPLPARVESLSQPPRFSLIKDSPFSRIMFRISEPTLKKPDSWRNEFGSPSVESKINAGGD